MVNKKIIQSLEDYGLKNKEAEVFTFLVGKNELTAYEIAKNLNLFRSTTYEVLGKLIEKGFVKKIDSGKFTYYSANEISSVLSRLKTKEDILMEVIQEIGKIKSEKPSVRILEGNIGQRQYNYELVNIIKERKITELAMIGNAPPEQESSLIFIEKIMSEIRKARSKKYGLYRGIWSQSLKGNKFVKKYNSFGENRFLSNVPSEVTTFITNNFVGFFFVENEVSFVIEVKSKTVASEMKTYFEILWNNS